ncbi:hypothetical protein F4782DRAFT_513155 [Xylaria castorea]|nr:hypothetical protein F4782DRAFT_513155 [Xylaria castorea]
MKSGSSLLMILMHFALRSSVGYVFCIALRCCHQSLLKENDFVGAANFYQGKFVLSSTTLPSLIIQLLCRIYCYLYATAVAEIMKSHRLCDTTNRIGNNRFS